MSVHHYENFPVASLLLPRRVRGAVRSIYAFARSADDIADEGDLLPEERMQRLTAYRNALNNIEQGIPLQGQLFEDLHCAITQYRLPISLFHALLDAFMQDVRKTRYEHFDELLAYCQCSANPVGRLLLHLFDAARAENFIYSDAVCSALQLINHWQDVALDWKKNRLYLPKEDTDRFGVSEEDIAQGRTHGAWRELMRFETHRARSMMIQGSPLGRILPGRTGWEIRAIMQGGLRILDKLEAVDFDVFHRRPRLNKREAFTLFLSAWRS
jgi:squalene synthase HpnC